MGTWTARNTGLNTIFEWWKSATVLAADTVAAYQFIGANSAAGALFNINNPGTNDLSTIGSPVWTVGSGFTYDGTNDAHDTGVAATELLTVLLRLQLPAASGTEYHFGLVLAGSDWYMSLLKPGPGGYRLTNAIGSSGGNDSFTGSTAADIVVGSQVTATDIRQVFNSNENTWVQTAASGTFAATAQTLYIGGRNDGTGSLDVDPFTGLIRAVAIYNRTLTLAETLEISANMLAITEDDRPTPLSMFVNWITQNPSTRHLVSTNHELWVATNGGIFRTLDGGRQWTEIMLPDPSNAEFGDSPAATTKELTFHWIDYDPTDESIIYAMGAKGSSSRVWIYKTTDLGITWVSRGVLT